MSFEKLLQVLNIKNDGLLSFHIQGLNVCARECVFACLQVNIIILRPKQRKNIRCLKGKWSPIRKTYVSRNHSLGALHYGSEKKKEVVGVTGVRIYAYLIRLHAVARRARKIPLLSLLATDTFIQILSTTKYLHWHFFFFYITFKMRGTTYQRKIL